MAQWQSPPMHPPERAEPRSCRISLLLSMKCSVYSPPLGNDPLRPHSVEQQDELYSPSSPLDLSQLANSDSDPITSPMETQSEHNTIVLALPCQSSLFIAKKHWDFPLGRSQSNESWLLPDADVFQARHKRRRRWLEEWEAKGAFIIWSPGHLGQFTSKAVTDTSLAHDLGVEPGESITSKIRNKHPSIVSPEVATKDWLWKRNKSNNNEDLPLYAATDHNVTTGMAQTHWGTTSTTGEPSDMEDVADPQQPTMDPWKFCLGSVEGSMPALARQSPIFAG